jgi:hypothetical protein
MKGYSQAHWTAVKHVIRYLKGTRDLTICYDRGAINLNDPSTLIPKGFSDADWGNDPIDRKSVTGIIFSMCGGPISWSCRKQKRVVLSTAEAELGALSDTFCQALYIRKLLHTVNLNEQIPVASDSQSAIAILEGEEAYNGRMKHHCIKLQHMKETIQYNEVKIEYCPTDQMPADMLTKALGANKLQTLKTALNMKEYRN